MMKGPPSKAGAAGKDLSTSANNHNNNKKKKKKKKKTEDRRVSKPFQAFYRLRLPQFTLNFCFLEDITTSERPPEEPANISPCVTLIETVLFIY